MVPGPGEGSAGGTRSTWTSTAKKPATHVHPVEEETAKIRTKVRIYYNHLHTLAFKANIFRLWHLGKERILQGRTVCDLHETKLQENL